MYFLSSSSSSSFSFFIFKLPSETSQVITFVVWSSAQILKKYSSLAKPDKDGPQADPFVIALAVSLEKDPQKTLIKTIKKRIIVTEERLKGSKEKIPFVCKDYDIDCINVIELFRTEGWKFQ